MPKCTMMKYFLGSVETGLFTQIQWTSSDVDALAGFSLSVSFGTEIKIAQLLTRNTKNINNMATQSECFFMKGISLTICNEQRPSL